MLMLFFFSAQMLPVLFFFSVGTLSPSGGDSSSPAKLSVGTRRRSGVHNTSISIHMMSISISTSTSTSLPTVPVPVPVSGTIAVAVDHRPLAVRTSVQRIVRRVERVAAHNLVNGPVLISRRPTGVGSHRLPRLVEMHEDELALGAQ